MGYDNDLKCAQSGNNKNKGRSPLKVLDNIQDLPLPKGYKPYARGKKAEYIKDLEKAKFWYMRAIRQGDKVSSAILDYASILHQQHQTSKALAFLDKNRKSFKNTTKVDHLYNTLLKQLTPSPNCLNKTLRIESVSSHDTEDTIKGLFSDSSRILKVSIEKEYAFLYFQSHSAARKTLEKFQHWNDYTIFWISDSGVVQNEVGSRHLMHFDKVPEEDAVFLLGKKLYDLIN